MTIAKDLRKRMTDLVREAQARGGEIDEFERGAFTRRIAELRERAEAERQRLEAEIESHNCDVDDLELMEGDALDLEQELDEAGAP